MNVEDMNNKFKKWNPMENDFKNEEFNRYVSGPGAELDTELQRPGMQLKSDKPRNMMKPVPTLIFRNMPPNMTTNALYNICSKHGAVTHVRNSTKNPFYFVDLATVADMEAIFRALEHNNYGFQVFVCKNSPKTDAEKNANFKNHAPVLPRTSGIDYESRNFRTSQKNFPRPTITEQSLLNPNAAINVGLPLNLLVNDAHALERKGLQNMPNNNNFSYRNGRAFINMPQKMTEYIGKKNMQSLGSYNISEDKYTYVPDWGSMPNNLKKCSHCDYVCDTICERCSQHYCSKECQKDDWPDHRYICGKPKNLQKAPPSKAKLQSDNKLQNLPNQFKKSNAIKAPTLTEIQNANAVSKVSETSSQEQTYLRKPSPKALPGAIKALSKVHANSAKDLSEHKVSSAKSAEQLAPVAKKLPASIKSLNQFKDSSKKTIEQVSKPQTPSVERLSTSSTRSQENSNKTQEDTYKRNMPRSGNIVTITSIVKTNLVFIRSISYDDNVSYFNTVDTLQTLGKALEPLKTLPKSGELVIAKFEGQYNRALVLNAKSPTEILIHFMDYGNMEQSKLEDLFVAPQEFIYKPRHAIPVSLKDVTDFYMTQEIRQFMHSYLNNISVEIRYKPEDFNTENKIYAVELIDENTEQNLNKMIVKLSKPIEPQNSNEICDRNYLTRKILPTGSDVELFVMDNSLMCTGCISCTIPPYAIEIEKFKKDIQSYIKSIPEEAYTPRVDELCIAKYHVDNVWYRGVCIETAGDGFPSILFIDYGNITIVSIESIRRYPPQFTFPIYTFDCAVDGLPEFCQEDIVTKLEELIPQGKLIKCENVTAVEEDHFYFLSLPNIIRELNKSGLIAIDI